MRRRWSWRFWCRGGWPRRGDRICDRRRAGACAIGRCGCACRWPHRCLPIPAASRNQGPLQAALGAIQRPDRNAAHPLDRDGAGQRAHVVLASEADSTDAPRARAVQRPTFPEHPPDADPDGKTDHSKQRVPDKRPNCSTDLGDDKEGVGTCTNPAGQQRRGWRKRLDNCAPHLNIAGESRAHIVFQVVLPVSRTYRTCS